jgi:hypothetical protein
MAIVAQLVPTPIPGTTQNGDVPGTLLAHVTITPAGGAGTYTFPHNLQWAPTAVFGIARLTEGTTPTTSNSLIAYCAADTTTTLVAVNVGGNGTYDVFYA